MKTPVIVRFIICTLLTKHHSEHGVHIVARLGFFLRFPPSTPLPVTLANSLREREKEKER